MQPLHPGTKWQQVVVLRNNVTISPFSYFAEWTQFVPFFGISCKICCGKQWRFKFIFLSTRKQEHLKENTIWSQDFQGISQKL